MKIFDCFMYFDEDMLLDLRLNILNPYVDYFVIVESKYTHSGDKKDIKFDISKFANFKDKIIYIVSDELITGIEDIKDKDNNIEIANKKIMNAVFRENYQRNCISNGLKKAHESDFILISDIDEIPNLSNLNFNSIRSKIIMFKQSMFYYKFNLKLPNFIWVGTKGCKKKNLKSPQWLRNIKDKKYNFFRFDVLLSDKKFIDITFINNGGWHFTNIKTPKEIQYKLKSYLHHFEFENKKLKFEDIDEIVQNKKAIYNLNADKRVSKIGDGSKLIKTEMKELPIYINENLQKYTDWIEK